LAEDFKKQEISQLVVTRMHDLTSEFSIIFRSHTPGFSQRRGQPLPALNTQPGLWPGAGHKRPGVGTQTSGLETEWGYSGRKERDGQKKKIVKANEKK